MVLATPFNLAGLQIAFLFEWKANHVLKLALLISFNSMIHELEIGGVNAALRK